VQEIILKVGEILGQECAARGANVLLGPTVNIHRSDQFSGDSCRMEGKKALKCHN
jgi:beta-glucosidase-like glycosyl hydrolase